MVLYLEKKVKLMNIASRINVDITGNEAKEITYDDCIDVINKLKYNSDSHLQIKFLRF